MLIGEALRAAGAPHGAVLVRRDGEQDVDCWGDLSEHRAVEAGSITKGITGLLLAAAVAREEVTPEDPLGRWLTGIGAAGDVTLASLGTHTSGLPRLPAGSTLRLLRHSRDPYAGIDIEVLRRMTRKTRVGTATSAVYSNLGAALLGQALATAAGTDYWTLAGQRVLGPLGMTSSGDLSEVWSAGHPWRLGAFGPAGGLRAPVTDLIMLAQLLSDPSGSPLGTWAADAFVPRAPLGEAQVCWFWVKRKDVFWHNGGTGSAWAIVAGRPGLSVAAAVGSAPKPGYDAAVLSALTA